MVGVEHHQRVVGVPRQVERVEDQSDVTVHIGGRGVIGGDDPALFPVGQAAENRRNLGFISGADVGDREDVGVEQVAKFDRKSERRVSHVEADPEEERLRSFF